MDVEKLDYAKNLYDRIKYFKELLDKIEKMGKADYVQVMEKDNKYCAIAVQGDTKLQMLEILYNRYSSLVETLEKEFQEI